MDQTIIIAGVTLSLAAARCAEESGCDVEEDLDSLRSNLLTEAALLDVCLDGADRDREQGWRDYVSALSAHLAAEAETKGAADGDEEVREMAREQGRAAVVAAISPANGGNDGWSEGAAAAGAHAFAGVPSEHRAAYYAAYERGAQAAAAELVAEEPAPALDPLAATLVGWTGSAEQIEQLRAFARSYPWDGPIADVRPIADADFAAGEVLSQIVADIEPNAEAVSRLRSYLVESAEDDAARVACGNVVREASAAR